MQIDYPRSKYALARSAPQRANSCAANSAADKQSQRASEKIGKYEKEVAEVRAVLEAVRLRLADAGEWLGQDQSRGRRIACPDCSRSC